VRLSEAFDKSMKPFTTLPLSHSCRVVYATLGSTINTLFPNKIFNEQSLKSFLLIAQVLHLQIKPSIGVLSLLCQNVVTLRGKEIH